MIPDEENARKLYASLQEMERQGELEFSWADLVKIAEVIDLAERDLKLIRGTRIVRGKAEGRNFGTHKIYQLQDVHEMFVAQRNKMAHPKFEWGDIVRNVDRLRRFGAEKETLFTQEMGISLINFLAEEFLPKVQVK